MRHAPTTVRTQAERTASTRALLVEAAIDSLVERGWAATTAVEVCARAGVARGALVHHFATLPGLLAAALDELCRRIVDEAGPPSGSLVDLIDAMWAAVSSPRFKAVIEAWLAAANDPAARDEIGTVVARFAAIFDPGNVAAVADDASRAIYLTAREAVIGMALGRACTGGAPMPHEATVLANLRAQAAAA